MFQAIQQRVARMLIEEAVAEWFSYICRFTDRTQETYQLVLRKFVQGLQISTIEELSPCHINSYISRKLAFVKNATANRHLCALKSFHRWLAENYDIPNHAQGIKTLKEAPPQQRFLSNEEISKVLSVCSLRERDCLGWLLHTGLRASEFCAVAFGDIVNGWIIVKQAKGRKLRKIPLNSVLREILARRNGSPETHIAFSKSRKQLYLLCCKLSKRAGIPRFGPHALRRAFATNLAEANIPLAHISILLGHSSIRTTELYLGITYASVSGDTEVLCK